MDWVIVTILLALYAYIVARGARVSVGGALLLIFGGGAMFTLAYVALLLKAAAL